MRDPLGCAYTLSRRDSLWGTISSWNSIELSDLGPNRSMNALRTAARRTVQLVAMATILAQLTCTRQSGNTPSHQSTAGQWCVGSNTVVDSAFVIDQATHAIPGTAPSSLKPSGIREVEEGFLVSVVHVRPTLGGGGLVWVNRESGCPIVLIHYE
jgi:hypothetical protein